MSGNFKFSGFGYLQKELQALLLFKNSIGGERHLQKQDLMTRIGYLNFKDGNIEDSIGLAEQLVLGTGAFLGLFI